MSTNNMGINKLVPESGHPSRRSHDRSSLYGTDKVHKALSTPRRVSLFTYAWATQRGGYLNWYTKYKFQGASGGEGRRMPAEQTQEHH